MDIVRHTRKLLTSVADIFNDHNERSEAETKAPSAPAHTAARQQSDGPQVTAQNAELQKLVDQAVSAFDTKSAAQCLECWEIVRKRFPSEPQGYIQAGFTALDLGEITLAENLATQAMEKFPGDFQAFRLHAEVAMSSQAFDIALSRWELVRKHFPGRPMGYTRAGIAALELGRVGLAQKLAAQAEKKFPDLPNVLQLRKKINETSKQAAAKTAILTFPVLLNIAENDLRMGLYKQAFMHYKLAIRHSPMQIRAYRGAVEAAMRMKDYLRMERVARDMISRFPLNIAGYKNKIQSLEAREEWAKALTELESIKKKFPQNPYGWQKYAEIQLKSGNYDRADAEMQEAVRLFPKNLDIALYFAQLPLLGADPQNAPAAIERCLRVCRQFPNNYNTYIQTLNICYKVIRLFNRDEYLSTYKNIFNCFLKHFNTNITLFDTRANKRKDKLALFSSNLKKIKYILPVIKCLPPDFVDIIISNNEDAKEIIEKYKLQDYNIIYDEEKLKEYQYILLDTNALFYSEKIRNLDSFFIGYLHSTDTHPAAHVQNCLSMLISASKNQMAKPEILPCASLLEKNTLPAHADFKCEVCYTGPYHLGDFLKKRHEGNSGLKAELAKELEIEIPENKPLVFMLEDENSHPGQLAYAANRMSEYATVIFKTLLPIADPRLKKFSSNVHIIRGPLAPNLPRFAADFVCCGYTSGSFTTSVMLGQNVLPYYSRLVTVRRPFPYFPMERYDDCMKMPKQNFRSAVQTIYSRFYAEGKLLDLVKPKAFASAIQGTEYRDWYHAILPSLQKEAFGDYLLDDAPQKTADYIMQFVKEGTLGKDCSSVYLKKKEFK